MVPVNGYNQDQDIAGVVSVIVKTMHYVNLVLANGCRAKVTGWLAKHYSSPQDAEVQYCNQVIPPADEATDASKQNLSSGVQRGGTDSFTLIVQLFTELAMEDQSKVLSELFELYMSSRYLHVPEDFLVHATNAMVQLKQNGRSNVLYNLAKGIGTLREDGSDSRFPSKRMSMGLVEYAADFFVADNLQKV